MSLPHIQIKDHVVDLTPKVREMLGITLFETPDPRTFKVIHKKGFANVSLSFEAREIVPSKDAD